MKLKPLPLYFDCCLTPPPLNVYVLAVIDGNGEKVLAYTGCGWIDIYGISWQECGAAKWRPLTGVADGWEVNG